MGAFRNKLREERGVVFILFIIVLLVLLAFAALALDVGNVMVVKNELQNISDGAALAAARKLGNIYEGMSYEQQQGFNASGVAGQIIYAAQEVGGSNKAGGIPNVTILDSDVDIGRWDAKTKIFTENIIEPDAVRVRVRKDGSPNSRVATFFARIFGMNEVVVSATATAALTGASSAEPGDLPIPFGISSRWFGSEENKAFCGKHIRLFPSCPHEPCDAEIDGCGGWHTYTDDFFDHRSANCDKLRSILTEIRTSGLESPYTDQQTMYQFTGGTNTCAFDAMKALFEANAKGSPPTWTTSVVVYESDSCANPGGDILIKGFTTVKITDVLTTPEKIIEGEVLCEFVELQRSGGGEYGTKGSIPGLVQ
jgi:hypothetical protein